MIIQFRGIYKKRAASAALDSEINIPFREE
jgi:hypothetical protein